METINNDKEKESELLYKRNKDKLSINKNFHTIFNTSKSSLSKLLQSVYNYKKRTCSILFQKEINNKNTNTKEINIESNTKIEEEQNKEKEQTNIEEEKKDEKKLLRNPSISSMTSHTSVISNKLENKKYACIASFNFSKNNKYQMRKRILNSRNNKSFLEKKNKNINIEYNDNNIEKNDEMEKIIEQLLSLEQNTVYLLTKIKIPEEFHKECTIWINMFTKTYLYKFKIYFNDINKESKNINHNISVSINQNINNNNKKEHYSQINYSINILIISLIIVFWRTDDNNIDLNININNYEGIVKDLSEIMIIYHKIYLLICLFILSDSNYLDNNYYNDQKITQLKDQMKKYLPKKISGNNYCYINNNLIIEELKSSSNILYSIIKIILKENKNNSIIYRLSKNINNLNETETSELVSYFYNYLNYHKNNFNDISRNLNINEYENSINENVDYNSIPMPLKKKYNIYNFQNKFKNIRHRKMPSDINNLEYSYSFNKNQNNDNYNNSLNDNNVSYNQIENNYNYNSRNNNKFINSFQNNYYSNNFSTANNYNQNNKKDYNDKMLKENINNYNNNNYDDSNEVINYRFNCRNNYNYSNNNINKKPEPPYLTSISLKNIKYSKKITLILDLDETLVCFKINKYNCQTGNVIFRPGLIQILNKLYPLFDLVIWTVATKEYADAILDLIEKDKIYFSARLYREHATIDNNIYVKDLSKLGRPLDSIIIVDDKESSYRLQKENGILIKPFMGSKSECQKDFILNDLFIILKRIMLDKSKDVRIGISNMKYEIQQKITNIKLNE